MNPFVLLISLFLFFFILFNVVPKFPYLFIWRATKMISKGQVEKGLEAFRKACRYKKIAPFTKVRYAFTELKLGDVQKARQMLLQVSADPKIPVNVKYEAKAVFALVLYKEGNLGEAKEVMDEVYENYKTTNVYCTLGYLYNILNDPQDAVKFSEEAMEYNDEHPVLMDNYGQALYLDGQYDKALELYEKLMTKKPNFPEAYYNYALVLQKKGDYTNAFEALCKAVKCPFNNLSTVSKEEVCSLLNEMEEKKGELLESNHEE